MRVIDDADCAFYLLLCLQSITLELLKVRQSPPVRVTTRVTGPVRRFAVSTALSNPNALAGGLGLATSALSAVAEMIGVPVIVWPGGVELEVDEFDDAELVP